MCVCVLSFWPQFTPLPTFLYEVNTVIEVGVNEEDSIAEHTSKIRAVGYSHVSRNIKNSRRFQSHRAMFLKHQYA